MFFCPINLLMQRERNEEKWKLWLGRTFLLPTFSLFFHFIFLLYLPKQKTTTTTMRKKVYQMKGKMRKSNWNEPLLKNIIRNVSLWDVLGLHLMFPISSFTLFLKNEDTHKNKRKERKDKQKHCLGSCWELKTNVRGERHSYQPVFLWALKLYAFCNKNIKKHGRERAKKRTQNLCANIINFEALKHHPLKTSSAVDVTAHNKQQRCFFLTHLECVLVLKVKKLLTAIISSTWNSEQQFRFCHRQLMILIIN